MHYPIGMILAFGAVAYVASTVAAYVISRFNFPLPPSRTRFGCIDGLRGYLALSVVIHHFIVWMQITRLGAGTWSSPTIDLFTSLGGGAVALFFMTTGFVFYPYIKSGITRVNWISIYISRAFRLIPLIIFSVVIISVIIITRLHFNLEFDAIQYIKSAILWIACWQEAPLLGYADSGRLNAYVLWSLGFEWLFYLAVLPLCALGSDLVRGRAPSWVVPVGLLVLSLGLRRYTPLVPMLRYIPLFAIGMIAFEIQDRGLFSARLKSRLAGASAFLCLAIAAGASGWPYGPIQLALYGIFFVCVASGNDLGGVLRTSGALVLGECSYGIYLLHGTFLSILFVDLQGFTAKIPTNLLPVLLPVVAIVVVLATSLTYLAIERPAIQLGKSISRRWSVRRVAADGPVTEVAP